MFRRNGGVLFTDYYNLSSELVVKKSYTKTIRGHIYFDRFFVYYLTEDQKSDYKYKIEIFSFEDCMYKDFQEKNPTFPDARKYIYVKPTDEFEITVNFKDCQKIMNSKNLEKLKSSFINEQINIS